MIHLSSHHAARWEIEPFILDYQTDAAVV